MKMLNHNESNCSATDLMSYLYGELREESSQGFERHLGSCRSCASEVAGFAILRESIGDWKREFDNLTTPAVELPRTAREVATADVSIIESVRAFLGLPALAGVSFGIALLTLGIVFFVNSSKPIGEIAGGDQNGIKAITSPTILAPVDPARPDVSTAPEFATVSPKDPEPVRVAERKAASDREIKPGTRKTGRVETRSSKKKTPTLIDDADDEDSTLRLADLFDEIGTE